MSVIRRTWTWHLAAPPAALWPVLSDTNRFNEAAKLPNYQLEEMPRPDGSVLRLGRGRIGFFEMVWEELPWDWIAGRRFEQIRRFRSGPFRSFGAALELAPETTGATVAYTVTVEPRGLLGRLLVAAGFFEGTRRVFQRMAQSAAQFVAGQRTTAFDIEPPVLPAGAAARAAALVARIEESPHGHGLARRLADHVLTAPDIDLQHLRPIALARSWKTEPRPVIELCLQAARDGLLRLSWDLLCPRCRGAKRSVAALDQLPKGAHCPSCNVGFDADFARNVELTFQPSPQIREVIQGGYCLSGPQSTPHVRLQQTLQPGESRDLTVDLAPGDYRLRTIEPGGHVDFSHASGRLPTAILDAASDEARPTCGLGSPAAPGTARLVNHSARPLTLVIESRDWVRDALTAHQVATLQAFRDLFGDQVLRPDEDVAIGSVTLMFTDLKGSTALYERIGDGPAYRLVRDHFAFLAEAVRAHNGALIKTIGDSVMAAFADPADGVRAALAVQARVAHFNDSHGAAPIVLRLGLHLGPCIAVTLNDRLDYFGGAVNLAARLEAESAGGDVVLSESLAGDPEVAKLLAARTISREQAALKGFARPVPFVRVSA